MSAEVLRQAASLMRERAEAARDITGASDWHVGGLDHFGDYFVRSSGGRVASQMVEEEAEHIASWHPAVALAVADVLSLAADHAAGRGNACGSCVEFAETLARAYLGGDE